MYDTTTIHYIDRMIAMLISASQPLVATNTAITQMAEKSQDDRYIPAIQALAATNGALANAVKEFRMLRDTLMGIAPPEVPPEQLEVDKQYSVRDTKVPYMKLITKKENSSCE